MKKISILFLLFSLILTTFGCNQDDSTIVEEPISFVRGTTFSQLPNIVQEKLNENSTILHEKAINQKGETAFGNIMENNVIESKKQNGMTIYTIGLDNVEKDFYYDNMVVVTDTLDNVWSYTTRYEPDTNWMPYFLEKSPDRYEHYSGAISIYNSEGNRVSSLALDNGDVISAKTDSETNRCEIVDVEIVSGCGNLSCFVVEINIEISCTDGGPSGGPGIGNVPEDETLDGDDSGGGGITTNPVEGGADELVYPSCESFEYSTVVQNGWITAATSGVWDTAAKWDRSPDIIIASFAQPLYFQLPAHFGGNASELSAALLYTAFEAWGVWFRRTYLNRDAPAVNPLYRSKLLELIKEEFQTLGGRVSLTPPSGFSGVVVPYQEANLGLGGGDLTCD